MRCPVFQGRDELGDHSGGPSEKDHEQHTDHEGPDAAPPRHRRPGVTTCDTGGAASDRKQKLMWSSAWGRDQDTYQSERTSVMSESSGLSLE